MIDYMNTRILGAIVDPESCTECRGRRDGVQIYSCMRLKDQFRLAWDVELALQICNDGRQPVPFERAQIEVMLKVNEINPAHLNHVDEQIPGIACVLDYTPDGQPIICLIDGSHRGARCLRLQIPFYVYLLSNKESLQCQQTEMARMFLLVEEHQSKAKAPSGSMSLFQADCAECQHKRNDPRVFTFQRKDGELFAWSVDLAIEICSDGRTPFPVPVHDLQTILGVNEVLTPHLDHVDPDIPGIACVCGTVHGQPLLVLVDGSHRAGRCLREQRPFLVYLLSEQESQQCRERVSKNLAEFVQAPFTL